MFLSRHNDPGIDAFVTNPALQAFAEQQAAIVETAQVHDLTDGRSILIGTGGLAAHGLNGHTGDGSTFDFDAFVEDPTFAALQSIEGAKSRPFSKPTEVHVPATDATLPVSGLRSPFHEDFVDSFRAKTFKDLGAQAVSANGILTLSPAELARTKLSRGETKDAADIIKAHFVAWATEHPIAQDPDWQWQVVGALSLAERRAGIRSHKLGHTFPWLGKLVASGFDNPAFRTLDTTPPFLRSSRAS